MNGIMLRFPARDAVDTAQQFHLEVDNATQIDSQRQSSTRLGNRLVFRRSRYRRARLMDALAVTLLMAFMALFGALMFLHTAPKAKADNTDPLAYAYAATYADAVCSTLSDHPTPSGVLGIMAGIREHGGLTREQAAEALVTSVSEACPWRMPILEAFAARGINA